MKLSVLHRFHEPSPSFSRALLRELETIGKQRRIDEAKVVVEQRQESSPAFHIAIHLVTPGPDLFAEASEHTLRAALQKSVNEIHRELFRRTSQRQQRRRSGPVRATTGSTARAS